MLGRRFFGSTAKAAAPMVSDVLCNVTLMDFEGTKTTIQGRVGQTLLEACEMNEYAVLKDDSHGGGARVSVYRNPKFTEDLYGAGPVSPMSHVVVASEWYDKLEKPTGAEENVLKYVPYYDITTTSRIASEIVLSKELDGLVVAVPEAMPADDE